MRFAPLLLLILAGCETEEKVLAAVEEDAAERGLKVIPCAIGEADKFLPICTVEDTTVDGKLYWIVRHPDGGFRRFQMIDNGTRIATADGADEVQMTRDGAEFIVKAGPDRYRFPAADEAAADGAR